MLTPRLTLTRWRQLFVPAPARWRPVQMPPVPPFPFAPPGPVAPSLARRCQVSPRRQPPVALLPAQHRWLLMRRRRPLLLARRSGWLMAFVQPLATDPEAFAIARRPPIGPRASL